MKNDNIIAMIYRKLRKSSMRPFFLSVAMIVMFGVTYSLILPAITAATVHPSLETEETTTLSGELLSVTVRARTPDSEEERVFVLLAESIGDYGAGLEEAISFDEEGIAVVLVSHSMEDVALYAERLFVMRKGELLYDDTPKAVFRHYKELEKIGLSAPQVTYIAHALQEKGFDIDDDVMTVAELKAEILRALGKPEAPAVKE